MELAAPRRIGAAPFVAVAGIVLVGVAVALRPEATTFGVLVLAFAAIAWRLPVAMVVGFAVVEPFQNLLMSGLPGPARYLDEAVVLVLFVAALVPVLIRRPARVLRDPFVMLAAAFLVVGLVSGAASRSPLDRSLTGLFVTVDYVLLFLFLRLRPPPAGTARVLVQTVVWLGVVATAFAVVQHLFPEALVAPWQHSLVEGGLARMPSLFRHPNAFGYYMLAATFLAVAAALARKSTGMGILAAVCAIGVFLSVSRSAGVALFIGLGIAGLVANRRLLRVGVLLAVLATTLMGPFFIRGIESRLHKIRKEGGDARITYVIESLPIVKAHPLLGIGPGRFGGEVAHRYGSTAYETYGIHFDSRWTTVDDFWLHLLVECGLAGVAIFLLLLALLFRRSLAWLRRTDLDPWTRAALLAVPMLVAAFALIDVTSMAFEANQTAGVFWLVSGVALASAGDVVRTEPLTADEALP